MINVSEAVKAAVNYTKEFRELLDYTNIRLEETEIDYDNKEWLITLSFTEHPFGEERRYRRIRLDYENGEVKSMKAYEIS